MGLSQVGFVCGVRDFLFNRYFCKTGMHLPKFHPRGLPTLSRNPFIQITANLRHFVSVELFQCHCIELVLNQLSDIAVKVAAISNDFLQRCQSVLPNLDLGFIALSMFYKKESSSWL